jgi:hypothetical protein
MATTARDCELNLLQPRLPNRKPWLRGDFAALHRANRQSA